MGTGIKTRNSGNNRQQYKPCCNRHIINLPAGSTRMFIRLDKVSTICGYGLDSRLVSGCCRDALSRALRISRFRLRK